MLAHELRIWANQVKLWLTAPHYVARVRRLPWKMAGTLQPWHVQPWRRWMCLFWLGQIFSRPVTLNVPLHVTTDAIIDCHFKISIIIHDRLCVLGLRLRSVIRWVRGVRAKSFWIGISQATHEVIPGWQEANKVPINLELTKLWSKLQTLIRTTSIVLSFVESESPVIQPARVFSCHFLRRHNDTHEVCLLTGFSYSIPLPSSACYLCLGS